MVSGSQWLKGVSNPRKLGCFAATFRSCLTSYEMRAKEENELVLADLMHASSGCKFWGRSSTSSGRSCWAGGGGCSSTQVEEHRLGSRAHAVPFSRRQDRPLSRKRQDDGECARRASVLEAGPAMEVYGQQTTGWGRVRRTGSDIRAIRPTHGCSGLLA